MNIPIAIFPSKTIRRHISPSDWTLYINTITELVESWLSCSPESLVGVLKSNHGIVLFLKSFLSELTEDSQDDSTIFSSGTLALHQKCLLLSCRLLSNEAISL